MWPAGSASARDHGDPGEMSSSVAPGTSQKLLSPFLSAGFVHSILDLTALEDVGV